MKKTKPIVVSGLAWYRKEQFQQLRMLASDPQILHSTYEDWLAEAEKTIPEMEKKGIKIQKVDVDLKELQAWCLRAKRPLNASARAEYVGALMKAPVHED